LGGKMKLAKKKTILDLYKMKENGEKAVWVYGI
jgi:hypothetical protein